MAAHESSQVSLSMTRQLAEFERARFDMRIGVARTLRAQGLSTPEIAEVFGVSRQLLHRILAGAADGSG
jgi:transcriptional regulator with XRE-family HTH domain